MCVGLIIMREGRKTFFDQSDTLYLGALPQCWYISKIRLCFDIEKISTWTIHTVEMWSWLDNFAGVTKPMVVAKLASFSLSFDGL